MSQQTPASPVEALQQAWALVHRSLLDRSDAQRWLLLGFCAWLATLAEGALSSGSQLIQVFLQFAMGSGLDPSDLMDNYTEHLAMLTIGANALVLTVMTVLWLRCHGAFMLLDNLAHDRALVRQPWREFAKPALSLLGLRLAVTATSLAALAGQGGAGAWLLWNDIQAQQLTGNSALVLAGLGTALVVTLLAWAVASTVVNDLAFPIMYARRCGSLHACRLAIRAVRAQPLASLGYLVLRWLTGFVASTVAWFASCLTCFLTSVPFIGTVLLLPIPVFLTGYAACFVEQLDEEYRIFEEPLASPRG